jgi:hypothetical protein
MVAIGYTGGIRLSEAIFEELQISDQVELEIENRRTGSESVRGCEQFAQAAYLGACASWIRVRGFQCLSM